MGLVGLSVKLKGPIARHFGRRRSIGWFLYFWRANCKEPPVHVHFGCMQSVSFFFLNQNKSPTSSSRAPVNQKKKNRRHVFVSPFLGFGRSACALFASRHSSYLRLNFFSSFMSTGRNQAIHKNENRDHVTSSSSMVRAVATGSIDRQLRRLDSFEPTDYNSSLSSLPRHAGEHQGLSTRKDDSVPPPV